MRVGDRVKYSARFLRSIACYAGDMAHGTGTVLELIPLGHTTLARVEWDRELPDKVNMKNLVLVDKLHLEE